MLSSRPDLARLKAPAGDEPATDPNSPPVEAVTDPNATMPSNRRLSMPSPPPAVRSSPLQREPDRKKPSSVGSSDPNPGASTRFDSALDPLVGQTVAAKYQILELIAVGGMGKVYKARQLGLDRIVCVKTLRPKLLDDPTTVGRFEREAKAASMLSHPNAIQVFDFGPDGHGSLFLAMEYLPGSDLRTLLLKEFPLGEPRVCRIMAQVLAALSNAHAQAIIHRDLKPENIMVDSRRGDPDFVKVLDFGIAKILTADSPALTLADRICGTPLYMSPEQATGGQIDARTDVYACGVILYQLVTGLLPFYSQNTIEVLTRHVNERPIPPRQAAPEQNISVELEKLILRAMAKDPDGRPPTADAFRQELLTLGQKQQAPRTPRAPPQELRPVDASLARAPAPAAAPEPADETAGQGSVSEVADEPAPLPREEPAPAKRPVETHPSIDELALVFPKTARGPARIAMAAGLVLLVVAVVYSMRAPPGPTGTSAGTADESGATAPAAAALAPVVALAPPPTSCPAGMRLVAQAPTAVCIDARPLKNAKNKLLANLSFDEAALRCGEAGKRVCAADAWCAALAASTVPGLGRTPEWASVAASAPGPALVRAGAGHHGTQCLVPKNRPLKATTREQGALLRCCADPVGATTH